MASELIYHDLIAVPYDPRRTGIYWLRLFCEDDKYLAVVTEVPGNPGSSVTNVISHIAAHILGNFRIHPSRFRLYQIHPRQDDYGEARIKRVTIEYSEYPSEYPGQPSWDEASRRSIENRIGGPLPELPIHEDLYRRVVEKGGGNYQTIYREIFEAVDVKDLPSFINPFRCRHSDRYERMADAVRRPYGSLSFHEELRIGREFTAALTAEDAAACHFHQANWRAIADESVRIITELGPQGAKTYERAANQSHLRGPDRRWLESLFYDPININQECYTNGQHRGCALRFSGAARGAVVVGSESLGQRCTDWHYFGDG